MTDRCARKGCGHRRSEHRDAAEYGSCYVGGCLRCNCMGHTGIGGNGFVEIEGACGGQIDDGQRCRRPHSEHGFWDGGAEHKFVAPTTEQQAADRLRLWEAEINHRREQLELALQRLREETERQGAGR